MSQRIRLAFLLLIPALFFLTGFFTLSDYGVNVDESAHFERGQAYLNYYLTGSKTYDNLGITATTPKGTMATGQRVSEYQNPAAPASVWLKDVRHPPLNGTLAAAFNKVFYQQLGWIGDLESYHLFEILVSTLGLCLAMWWAFLEFGWLAALFAGIALALHPMYFGESRFNIKDPIETVFFTVTLFAFWRAIVLNKTRGNERQALHWLLAAGVGLGFAIDTKFNAFFIPLILALWLLLMLATACVYYWTAGKNHTLSAEVKHTVRQWLHPDMLLGYALLLLVAAAVVYAGWPNLWGDGVQYLNQAFEYYFQIGTNTAPSPSYLMKNGWNLYPLLDVILRAPLMTLLLAGAGIAAFIRYWKTPQFMTLLLWLLWLVVPIFRVMLPGKELYGATRQIMEYIPALALFTGVGAAMIVESITKWSGIKHQASVGKLNVKGQMSKVAVWATAALVLCYLPIVITLTRLHPNPQLFYNSLIGGLKGARDINFPFWNNTMGNAFTAGIKWLNTNAESEAKLSLVFRPASDLPPGRLRSDIHVEEKNLLFSGKEQQGEYIMRLVGTGRSYSYVEENDFIIRYLKRFLVPVYSYKVDDVTILMIWKNDPSHQAPSLRSAQTPLSPNDSVSAHSIQFDFGQLSRFDRLELTSQTQVNCSPINDGSVSVSSDGDHWQRLDNLLFEAGDKPVGQHVRYDFAADIFRYISIEQDPTSCLLKNPIVRGWTYPTQP